MRESTNTTLELFNYGDADIRVIVIDGEPWFVAADVCRVIGIARPDVAVLRLDQDDRRQTEVVDSLGRKNPNAWVVNESGVYDLIIRSDKPEAKPFRRWLTSEVLPSIRKTGQYAMAAPQLPSYSDALRQLADSLDAQEAQRAELAAARPKVEFFDHYVDGAGNYKIGDVAKVLDIPGLGQNKLFQILRAEGVLISGGKSHNSPYQRHVNTGRFVVKVTSYDKPDGTAGSSMTTYATPKGLDYIRKVMASLGFESPVGGGVVLP